MGKKKKNLKDEHLQISNRQNQFHSMDSQKVFFITFDSDYEIFN